MTVASPRVEPAATEAASGHGGLVLDQVSKRFESVQALVHRAVVWDGARRTDQPTIEERWPDDR